MTREFVTKFEHLMGNEPFPWQIALYDKLCAGEFPASCNLPTGLGKTSIIPIWLLALASQANRGITFEFPRRLIYVVNRRTVVDQATREAEHLRHALIENRELKTVVEVLRSLAARPSDIPLAISTLRGQFADNREWSSDPARPAVIVGTVDMIGSRLLFNGYGVGFKGKPLHAGFLGQDALLVHDEAHLEPAFQKLLVAIEEEQQRCKDFRALRVMELSATSRGEGDTFTLTDNDRSNPEVRKRIRAKKTIRLHANQDEKKLAEEIADLATGKFAGANRAVLVFVRKVEDVEKVVKRLPKDAFQQLTGTLRGLERDRMADPRHQDGCPIFTRFLKPPKRDADARERWKVEPKAGTVYLVCTSAGEVGVNISADHLVCDLSTFDSMAQRFGRVNRFGDRDDTEIHVVHPDKFEDKDIEQRHLKTLKLLRELDGDCSPKALGDLKQADRLAAFAPSPTILPVSDILFDAWALTTIREKLPGRPPVEPYLHGVTEWQPPETHVAWREEVGIELQDRCKPEDLLEDYPLKPHELLRDRSDRVFNHLASLAGKYPGKTAWLIDDDGSVEPLTLKQLTDQGNEERIRHRTVLLPPEVGGLEKGMLAGTAPMANDVADEWFEDVERQVRRRVRVWDDDPERQSKTVGMRLVREIDTGDGADGESEGEVSKRRFWRWYVKPFVGDDDGSNTSRKSVTLEVHKKDVAGRAERIVGGLSLSDDLTKAVVVAARLHDVGKGRPLFQRVLGNLDGDKPLLAKSARRPNEITGYRHEFGSLLDIEDDAELMTLNGEMRDLVRHLIAAHHGRGRPHFPSDEAFDPEPKGKDVTAVAAEVPRRFARLQRKYGRWGLAYFESLLRAADYAASAEPSATVEDDT